MIYRSFLIALVASTAACSTITVNLPGPMVESPELAPQGKIEWGFGIEDSTSYTYTQDASRRPPTLNAPEIKNDAKYLYGRGGYTVLDWLEIGARIAPGSTLQNLLLSGGGLTTRAQLVGLGRDPGLKFAIYCAAFAVSNNASGDQNGTFGSGGYNWRATAKGITTTAGASLGYRFADSKALVFLAASYADQKVTGSIDQDLSSNGTSPAVSYSLSEVRGNTRTAAIGTRFGTDVQLGIDARYIRRNWPGTSSPEIHGGGETSELTYAVSLNFH